MEYYVEGRSRAVKYIETLLPSMLAQLNLTRSRKLLHIKLDPELEDLGTTVPFTGIDTYLVVLRPCKDLLALGATLAHELTHVAQMARGTLKITKNGRRWNGRYYRRDYPYLDQPWEIQAFAQQEIVLRRALEA
jgi:hypothetical protein